MQARRDQVDAQKYLSSRLSSALLAADPDAQEAPTRRDVRATIGALAIASIMIVAVGVYAMFFNGGSTMWRQPGTLVVDQEEGGRYVLVDGRLHPVRNVASAKLLLGAQMKTAAVKSAVLEGTPRGGAVGINGAPDALPTTVSGGNWRVCATTDVARLPGAEGVLDVVEVGTSEPGLDAGALHVVSGDREFLVVDSVRHELAGPWVADVLGFGGSEPVPVTAEWLGLLPLGAPLSPLEVPGAGTPGPVLDGAPTVVGQLFDTPTSSGPVGHYQLRADGLMPLTPVQFALAAAGAPGQRAVLSDYTLATMSRAAIPEAATGLPEQTPTVTAVPDLLVPCVQTTPAPDGAESVSAVLAPVATGASPVLAASGEPTTAVLATPDAVTLVASQVPTDEDFGDVHVVTDDGRAFPVADEDALSALGYSTNQVVVVAPKWLELLPTGPRLTRPVLQDVAAAG